MLVFYIFSHLSVLMQFDIISIKQYMYVCMYVCMYVRNIDSIDCLQYGRFSSYK